jgi:hypothetical protein
MFDEGCYGGDDVFFSVVRRYSIYVRVLLEFFCEE